MSKSHGDSVSKDGIITINDNEKHEIIPKHGDGDENGREVEVGLGFNRPPVWRESSNGEAINEFKFEAETHHKVVDDPPTLLISKFLHKQQASGEISLDMDLEMDELVQGQTTNFVNEKPKGSHPKVAFQESSPLNEPVRRRKSNEEDHQGHKHQTKNQTRDDEVVRCTSNSSMKRNSSLLKTKSTKSRLMDPPSEKLDKKSGRVQKSGQLRSGYLGRLNDDEEEDPFAEEDLPDEYKKAKFNTLTVLQWVSLILLLGALICNLTIRKLSKKRVWGLPLWKWELSVLVLICGRLVSGWGIKLVVFFIERNFIWRKRVLYFVYGLRKAVQNCLWLGLVLIAWHFLFDQRVANAVEDKKIPLVITKILISLVVATLLWLVKTLLVKVLASSFHVSTYFDRIQDSLFNQYIIETLSGRPMMEIQKNQEEEDEVMAEVQKLQNAGAKMPADLRAKTLPSKKSGRILGNGGLQKSPKGNARSSGTMAKAEDKGITIDQLHRLNQKNVSAWKMKRLMSIIRRGVLSTLDEHIYDSSHDDESTAKIRTEFEAKCAARKIFNNVATTGSRYIYMEDIMRFMREDEAEKTMSLFEGETESKKVSKKSLKNWVVNAFRERRALALTLDDTKTAVNQLHRMVDVVIGILIVIITLIILGVATTKLLVFISSQLLLVAFMFGNTCKMVFEAIIFLFVMHPFDVGDRCEIDGIQMVVEEMNILTTVFLKFDNHKIIYPNSVLSTKPISNYYRSPDMADIIDYCIHVSTPAEKIATMKQRLTMYIEKKHDHWYPSPLVVVRDVIDLNKLTISVRVTHRMNHHDMAERWTRRGQLVEELIKILRELDIEYRMLPFDVNLRNLPGLSSNRLPSTWTASNSL